MRRPLLASLAVLAWAALAASGRPAVAEESRPSAAGDGAGAAELRVDGDGAAELRVEADRGSFRLADPVRLTLEVVAPADVEVTLPGTGVDLGPFDLLDHRLLDPDSLADGRVRHTALLTATAYDVGSVTLPPLSALVRGPDGRIHAIHSDSLMLGVEGVLPAVASGSDTTDIRPLKGQVDVPREIPWWLWGLGLLVVVGVLALFLYLRARRRQLPAVGAVVDRRPPDQIALVALAELRDAGLPGRGLLKEHYTRLIDILRPYLERRFGFPAVDRTTSEILETVSDHLGPSAESEGRGAGPTPRLRRVFEKADLVKFARLRPPAAVAEGEVDRAEEFVRDTARRHVVSATVPGNGAESPPPLLSPTPPEPPAPPAPPVSPVSPTPPVSPTSPVSPVSPVSSVSPTPRARPKPSPAPLTGPDPPEVER